MNNYFFQKLVDRLEYAGNDDYALIVEFGAEAYSNNELQFLLEEIDVQHQIAIRWQQQLFIIAISISLCIGTSLVFSTIEKALVWSYTFLCLVPVAIIYVSVMYAQLQKRYPNLRKSHLIASIIQQELERRKTDASIY